VAVPAAPRSLSRRDATAFVRAVRRFGLKSKLPAIVSEVGGVLEEAGLPQQLSLWRALVGGCRRALDLAAQADQQPEPGKVRLQAAVVWLMKW
jgi:chromodomain-helicase-DNA-binding protein 1